MEINIKIDRIQELTKAFQQAPNVVQKQMNLALKKSLRDIVKTAKAKHNFTSRTGNLERAVDYKIINDLTGVVFIDPAVAGYGVFVHGGTKPHKIRPRRKKTLRWPIGGGFAFAAEVNHPGTKADPFLYEAAEFNQDSINAIFAQHVDRAIKEAGL